MHELPVTESILEIALRHAEKAGARRVTGLYLVIGQLSSLLDDSIQFYWDIIAKDTLAEGATLHFNRIPTEIECQECKHHYSPENGNFLCPKCGSIRIKIISGEELRLEAIDVE
jgi:hydrogenase nickel incorporation protein HypA/HybF